MEEFAIGVWRILKKAEYKSESNLIKAYYKNQQ